MGWWSKLKDKMAGQGNGPGRARSGSTASTPAASFAHSGLRVRYGVVTTVGNHREHNEDNFYVPGRPSSSNDSFNSMAGETTTSHEDPGNEPYIVADGMGGQQAGEEASRMAVEIIPRAVTRRLNQADLESRDVQVAIRDAVAEANQEILGSSGAVTEYSNMGTTVVLAVFRGEMVYVAGIGDSRAYRFRDGRLDQLTRDHSLADALGDAGTISKEEVAHHKYKNVLYLYLGCKDARGGPEDVRALDVRPGDKFLLATDGLTGVVPDVVLARALETEPDPRKAAQSLVDQALANDSKDNVTVMVLCVDPSPHAAGRE
jgi:protein phosphatase